MASYLLLIGHGGFGHVVLCKNKIDGRQYAVKKIQLKDKSLPLNDRILRYVCFASMNSEKLGNLTPQRVVALSFNKKLCSWLRFQYILSKLSWFLGTSCPILLSCNLCPISIISSFLSKKKKKKYIYIYILSKFEYYYRIKWSMLLLLWHKK